MPTLDWLNRAQAFTTAAQVPYRLLDNVSTHGDPQHGKSEMHFYRPALQHQKRV